MTWFRSTVLVLGLTIPAAAAPSHPVESSGLPSLGGLVAQLQRARLNNGLRVVLNPQHAVASVAIAFVDPFGAPADRSLALTRRLEFGVRERAALAAAPTMLPLRQIDQRCTHGVLTSCTRLVPAHELALGVWLSATWATPLANDDRDLSRWLDAEVAEQRGSDSSLAAGFAALVSNDRAVEQLLRRLRTGWSPGATLALVGDFETDRALELVAEHFAGPPADPGAPLPAAASPADPPTSGASPLEFRLASAAPLELEEQATWEVAVELLLGPGSALRRRLLAEGLATSVVGQVSRSGASIIVEPVPAAASSTIIAQLEAALRHLQRAPLRPAQLGAAKLARQNRLMLALEEPSSRARVLAEFEASYGDARLAIRHLGNGAGVTAAQVRGALSGPFHRAGGSR